MSDLKQGDYEGAVARLAKAKAMGLLTANSSIARLEGANAIAGLAALPIELALNQFADAVSARGFEFQVRHTKLRGRHPST